MLAILEEQCRHQVRVSRQRIPWFIPAIFIAGLMVSLLGLIPALIEFRESKSPTFNLFLFGVFTLLFGWVVVSWLLWPYWLRPRIVPYFPRELGRCGGPSMAAFRRGRALYQASEALERLAESLHVQPLTAFGFAYDFYGQEVKWHAVPEGLRTVEALQRNLEGSPSASPEVARDLAALRDVLRMAADQNVEFSLVLRLDAKESLQAVCTREVRQGSFW
jgi:hypothetical protein